MLGFIKFLHLLCRMDEMMRGQRGWRELAVLGDKMNKFTGMIEGLIWSPKSGDKSKQVDDWAFEEVFSSVSNINSDIVIMFSPAPLLWNMFAYMLSSRQHFNITNS